MSTRPLVSPLLLGPSPDGRAAAPLDALVASSRTVSGPGQPSARAHRPWGAGALGGGGAAGGDEPGETALDALAPFARLIAVLRWLALVVGTTLLLTMDRRPTGTELVVLVVCWAWTVVRTIAPARHLSGARRSDAAVVIDLAVAAVAVMRTGAWASPFVAMLLPGVTVAGLAWGGVAVGFVALAQALFVGAAEVVDAGELTSAGARPTVQGAGVLVLVALLAGFGRRIIVQVEEERSEANDHVSRLSEANTLLYSLHQLAQTLPASLDLQDVLTSTVDNVRALFDTEVVAVLLDDETSPSWVVGRVDGLRLPSAIPPEQLPPGMQRALRTGAIVTLADLAADERRGLSPTAGSGVYVPLRARDRTLAVLVSEHGEAGRDDPATVELMRRVAEPASLAIDNARWFGRLRTVAADEERGRIARDLHDRIGQMLAYLGFELDRLSKQARDGGAPGVAGGLDTLRTDVRRVVSEVRETLYDLRTDVSDGQGLVPTLQSFLDRVAARTGIAVDFEHDGDGGLPVRLQRELWRVAQEAVTNVERHANATRLTVRWQCGPDAALLEVEDDGKGFGAGEGRVDSYGMRGIRERAAAINARLDITSEPGRGTTVRCRLPRAAVTPPAPPAPSPTGTRPAGVRPGRPAPAPAPVPLA